MGKKGRKQKGTHSSCILAEHFLEVLRTSSANLPVILEIFLAQLRSSGPFPSLAAFANFSISSANSPEQPVSVFPFHCKKTWKLMQI